MAGWQAGGRLLCRRQAGMRVTGDVTADGSPAVLVAGAYAADRRCADGRRAGLCFWQAGVWTAGDVQMSGRCLQLLSWFRGAGSFW